MMCASLVGISWRRNLKDSSFDAFLPKRIQVIFLMLIDVVRRVRFWVWSGLPSTFHLATKLTGRMNMMNDNDDCKVGEW